MACPFLIFFLLEFSGELTMRLFILGSCLAAWASASLSADVVVLKDGTRREGKVVRETEAEVLLTVEVGDMSVSVTIPQESIDRVERTETVYDRLMKQYLERLRGLDTSNAQDWYELGLWCEQQPYLSKPARRAFETAMDLSPDHEGVRRRLGFVKQGDGWQRAGDGARGRGVARPEKDATPGKGDPPPSREARELIDEAYGQASPTLRERAETAEAQLSLERKLRADAERRVRDLEERVARLERELGRQNVRVERQPVVTIENQGGTSRDTVSKERRRDEAGPPEKGGDSSRRAEEAGPGDR
jgi:hypothetical protein